MPPIGFVAAPVILLVATGTAAVLIRFFGAPSSAGRYATIDGLRGYLALFVFLHHSSIWFFYLRSGRWEAPPSNLFTQFGQGGVALFFMITGFLFFTKLLETRNREMDWTRLYVSRVLRLVPLYAFAMMVMFSIVAQLSGWKIAESVPSLLRGAAVWLGFTFGGVPDLNAVERTWTIVAGVTWSLPYEWLFYFSLPLVGIALRLRPSVPYLLLSLCAAIGALLWRPGIAQVLWFGGGIAAALAVRIPSFRAIAAKPVGTLAAIVSLTLLVVGFPTAYGVAPLMLLTIAFALIAGGCTLFGVLTNSMSRLLGDIAYSVYMLHGISLFVLFKGVIGTSKASSMSPSEHWGWVILCTPILILGCFTTYRLIEKPAMDSVSRVVAWLRFARQPRADAEESVASVRSS